MITRRRSLQMLRTSLSLAVLGIAGATVQCQPVDAPAAEADPILDLIAEYRHQLAIYNASGDLLDDDYDALAQATYGASWRRLCTDPPVIRSLPGAIAALTLVAEEMAVCTGSFELPVIRAVVAYFEGRA